ncbi:MAG: M20 family metallopeptidase [Thermodesulfobacteriota bacterium]|nr:M20 family metallopeptidase [Thermodesulfobacteriota bacterium]
MKKFDFYEPEASQLLEDLGQIAEPSFKEFETTRYIVNFLHTNNIPTDKVFETGCFGTIDVGAEKTIALRADIDALPANQEGTEFKHLCGHHSHTAMLLLALKYLVQHQSELKVNIRYIFQPAEELGSGALFMINEGCLAGCAEIYGIHVDAHQKLGDILLKPGEFMAGAVMFEVKFTGNSTHAAYPHTGDDVLVAATDYVNLCQKIITRFKNPIKKAVLSFAQISGGQAFNILAEELQMKGTYRYFDAEVKQLIEQKMAAIGDAIKLIYEVDVAVTYVEGTLPLLNQKELTRNLIEIFSGSELHVNTDLDPMMGAEDFSYYMEECPGVFVKLGVAGESGHPPLHNKDFFVPVKAVLLGTMFWIELTTNHLIKKEM